MITKLRSAFKHAPVLTSAFAIAVCMTLWFGGRTAVHAIYWADPKHQNQEIDGWMTLGYVSKSWHVPRDIVKTPIDEIWPDGRRDRYPPIHKIAERTGMTEAAVIAILTTAIQAHHARPAE